MPGRAPSVDRSELEALLASPAATAVLDAIFGATPSGAAIADHHRILRVSDHGGEIVGLPREALEALTLEAYAELVHGFDEERRAIAIADRPLQRAVRGEVTLGLKGYARRPDGELTPVLGSAAPIRNARGEVIGGICSVVDMGGQAALEAQLRRALEQQRELYRELTHRVKNHLHLLSGLVELESRDAGAAAQELAERIQGRLSTLASVYDGMTRAGAGGEVEARAFVEEVCRPYRSEWIDVEVSVAIPGLSLNSDQAGPFGMLVNEAVCNSCKHAFPDQSGRIAVSLSRTAEGRLALMVEDDGVGWGDAPPSEASHGLRLMRLYTRQLGGELQLSNRPGGGARVVASLPMTARDSPAATERLTRA